MYRKIFISMISLVLIVLARPLWGVEHDHQPWNMISVGRLVAMARTDVRECRTKDTVHSCAAKASQEAVDKLYKAMHSFECRAMTGKETPKIDTLEPLSRHDKGPLFIAELKDIKCRLSPRRQLFPIYPEEFKRICSRLDWKCDVIWISDSDPGVWHINRWDDVPPHAP